MNTNCLASTGAGDTVVFIVIAAVLLAAGIVVFAVARRRGRWAALAIVPLLLALSLGGPGASSAQAAAADPCATAATSPAPISWTPTPPPTPACTPVEFADASPALDRWSFTEGGIVASYDDSDAAVADAWAARTAEPVASITVHLFVQTDGGGYVERSFSFDSSDYEIDTVENTITVGYAAFEAAVEAELGSEASYYGTGMDVVLDASYDDGCGQPGTARLEFDGLFPQAG